MFLKNNIKIDYGKKENKDELYRLWQACFHDTKAFADYYFERIFKHNRIMTLKESDVIVSMLHLNPYRIYLDGKVVNSEYIVGVATEESHRCKGYMRLLLIMAMKELYKEKKPFVYLMPARESIYTPFDFTFIYKQPVMDIESGSINCPADSQVMMSRQADVHDLDTLVEFANAMLAEQFDVFAYRDRYYFENLLEETKIETGQIRLLYKDKVLIGYIATSMTNNTIDQQLFVRELIVLPDYLEQVYRWMKQYFEFERGKLLLSMIEPPFHVSEYKPVIMARIIHLEQLMQFIKVPENFCIRMQVADSILEGNNGKFLWTRRWQLLPGNEPVDMVITIEALTSWLFGYKTLDKLVAEKSVYLYNDCRETLRHAAIIKKILLNEFV